MKNLIRVFLLVFTGLGSIVFAEAKDIAEKDIWVGCEYFNGWWEQSPNKWESKDKDWRAQYPERIPLLGEYNSQETMDKEIKAAADHGVDFFSILYYYGANVGDTPMETNALDYLNNGLKYYMNSPNSGMMSFMVELCNHEPFAIKTDKDWEECADICIKAMKHSSYLRVDGQAVLKIHGANQFYADCGSSISRAKHILQTLRQKARQSGVGELLITAGTYELDPIDEDNHFVSMGDLDGTMQYMDPTELPQKNTDYSFDILADRAQVVRDFREQDVLPYVPYFPAGWNPRPWGDPRAAFSFPSKKKWKTSLRKLKKDLEESSSFGFPKKDGTVQKAFTIYAWNEYGEGGILAPNNGDQYMKLEVLKSVFGK